MKKEKAIALTWGMVGFEEDEPDQPAFQSVLERSLIDGKLRPYFSPAEHRRRVRFGFVCIFVLILLVIASVVAVFEARGILDSTLGIYGQYVMSVFSSVQIYVLNYLYHDVATKLTDYENHQTFTRFEDAMGLKLFLFQFVNAYSQFFYIAFIAEYVPKPAGAPDNAVRTFYGIINM